MDSPVASPLPSSSSSFAPSLLLRSYSPRRAPPSASQPPSSPHTHLRPSRPRFNSFSSVSSAPSSIYEESPTTTNAAHSPSSTSSLSSPSAPFTDVDLSAGPQSCTHSQPPSSSQVAEKRENTQPPLVLNQPLPLTMPPNSYVQAYRDWIRGRLGGGGKSSSRVSSSQQASPMDISSTSRPHSPSADTDVVMKTASAQNSRANSPTNFNMHTDSNNQGHGVSEEVAQKHASSHSHAYAATTSHHSSGRSSSTHSKSSSSKPRPVHFTFSAEDIRKSFQKAAEKERARLDREAERLRQKQERMLLEQHQQLLLAHQQSLQASRDQAARQHAYARSLKRQEYDRARQMGHFTAATDGESDSDSDAYITTEGEEEEDDELTPPPRRRRGFPIPPRHFKFDSHDIHKSFSRPSKRQQIGHWTTFPRSGTIMLSANKLRTMKTQLMQKQVEEKRAMEMEEEQRLGGGRRSAPSSPQQLNVESHTTIRPSSNKQALQPVQPIKKTTATSTHSARSNHARVWSMPNNAYLSAPSQIDSHHQPARQTRSSHARSHTAFQFPHVRAQAQSAQVQPVGQGFDKDRYAAQGIAAAQAKLSAKTAASAHHEKNTSIRRGEGKNSHQRVSSGGYARAAHEPHPPAQPQRAVAAGTVTGLRAARRATAPPGKALLMYNRGVEQQQPQQPHGHQRHLSHGATTSAPTSVAHSPSSAARYSYHGMPPSGYVLPTTAHAPLPQGQLLQSMHVSQMEPREHSLLGHPRSTSSPSTSYLLNYPPPLNPPMSWMMHGSESKRGSLTSAHPSHPHSGLPKIPYEKRHSLGDLFAPHTQPASHATYHHTPAVYAYEPKEFGGGRYMGQPQPQAHSQQRHG